MKNKAKMISGRIAEYDEAISLDYGSPNYLMEYIQKVKGGLEFIGVGIVYEVNGAIQRYPSGYDAFFIRKGKKVDQEAIVVEVDNAEFVITGDLASKVRENIANQIIRDMTDLEKDLIRSTANLVPEDVVLRSLKEAHPHMTLRQLRWMYTEILRSAQ